MAIKKINDLGGFADLSAVWSMHPEGGRDGDYVTINNSTYYWDSLARNWVLAGSGQGGSSSQTVDGDLTVGGNLNVGGSAHVNGDMTVDGVINASGIHLDTPLPVPKDGQSVFKSLVFKRAASRPNAPLPTDGSYYNPVPVNKGWSDGIPAGTDPIWMTCRVFTDDQQPPQGNWSTPELLADSETFDVEFSPSETRPEYPSSSNMHNGSGTQVWFDPVLDAPEFSRQTMRWMATRTRTMTGRGPQWGPWNIIKVVGENGDDGVGTENAYTVYSKTSAPTINNRYGDVPQSYGCTWQRTTNGLTIAAGQALYMSERTVVNNVAGPWGDAVRISGDGAPGQDGADIEFIYKQMDRLPGSGDAKPSNDVTQDGYVPTSEGWYSEAKGVDATHKCEWMCQRVKPRGSEYWGDWTGPFAWSVYGDTGMDGASVQYVFRRTTAEEGTPARPTVTNEGYTNEQGEFIPHGWTDDPMGVNEYYVKEWVSIRRKGERQTEWGSFSDPALWATYSKQHTVEIKDGYWWIDGVKTQVKAEGEDGTGVKMKGAVDYYLASEATSAGGGATSLEGENTSSLEVGDCYVVRHGSKEGYIYAYNGGSTWSNNWTELGKFKGADGDPGTSMYLHIAWSYQIDFQGGVPVGTIYTNYATLPISQYGYPEWQGIAVTSSDPSSDNYNPTGADPTQASAYEWNHIRGKDGSDYERVYIRTKKNVRPQVETGASQSDDHLPLCVNGSVCEAEYTQSGGQTVYQFTDDPIGPDPSWPYEWMAERKKTDGAWGQFGTPVTVESVTSYCASLWAIYSKPPTITVDAEGYWLIDNNRVPDLAHPGEYIRAKGEKGDGIRINGSYASLTELNANVSLADRHVGDCYYITSGADAGHLYVWDGSDWQNIGEIKGEPGQSQYMFIAWATNVNISGNTVTSVEGFSLNSGTGYNWVGLLAYDSPTLPPITSDPTQAIKLAFKWNYIKGMDGDQYEYVYIRTTTNDSPGVKNDQYPNNYVDSRGAHPSDDDFLPADGSGLDANNRPIHEYTDDPNGVDSTNQFEWQCYRRKTAGAWGQWFGPYLVHNWAKDGEGQLYVDTGGVDRIVIDCDAEGHPKTQDTIYIEAKLYIGTTRCGAANSQGGQSSSASVVVDCTGFDVAGSTKCTYSVSNNNGYSVNIRLNIKTAATIASGTIMFTLRGGDADGNPVSANKVVNIVANLPGAKGANGNEGPCLRYRGEYSSTVDQSNDGYIWNNTFRDCVKSGNTYYLVNFKTNGDSALGAPENNSKWLAAGGNLKFLATELLLAENGAINLLSSNVINLFNSSGDKVASINADGHGNYVIYYPYNETLGKQNKRMEDSYDGWRYYYNDDADNTIQWMLGPGGTIIKTVSVSMYPIQLSTTTVCRPDYNLDGNDPEVTMATRYIYANDQSANNGKVYDRADLNNNEPLGSVIPDGTYAAAPYPLQEPYPLQDLSAPGEETVQYYLPVVVISGGKITRRYEWRSLSN